jgi:nickel-dependent lactate racemase
MRLEFGYDKGVQAVEIPDGQLLGVLEPQELPLPPEGGEALVRTALQSPIGSPAIGEIFYPGERVVIITSDVSRPMPTWEVMPPLLDALYAAGIRREDITLIFARGVHRAQTDEERRRLAGERAFAEISCIDSDSMDTVMVGTTARGTPVEIMRAVAEADRRICLGNIEFHYFAGFSGGAKAIMPGVSTRAAIRANHSHMVEPGSHAGSLAGNPVREDIEEAAAMVGVDFIVNVVLDAHKRIVHAVAGDVTAAHRAGCAFLEKYYRAPIEKRADIVLVSQGGAPKDANLYQLQKALDNAKHAVREGGVIVLIGCAKEGFGEDTFEQWFREADSPAALIDRLRQNFTLGGHKAAAIALVEQLADVYLVSDWSDEAVLGVFMTPFPTAQAALDAAMQKCGQNATILAMPYGGSTLPGVK